MAEEIQEHYIYAHVKKNTNDVFYIGKGKNRRIASTSGRNKWWRSTVNKYGYDYFKIEEGVKETDANELEKYWISQFKAWGFKLVNATDGGEGVSGHKRDMVQYNLKVRPRITGRKQSDSEKKMRSDIANYRYKNRPDIAIKIKNTQLMNNNLGKKICQYSKNGELLNTFKSIKEASLVLNILRTAINNNVKGISNVCGGFKFKYSN